MESDLLIRDCHIILGKAYIGKRQTLTSVKSVKIITAEGSCDLSRTIRAEVKEDHAVICGYLADRLTIFCDHGRDHKLIRLAIIIGCLHSADSIACCIALAKSKCTVGLFHTIPTIVTIHGIITTGKTGDLTDTDLCHLLF